MKHLVAVERAQGLDDECRRVWLCREDRGPQGSFKWRGADTHCSMLAQQGAVGVVAASTGNFAAAVAWAAPRHGLVAHVVVPTTTSQVKLQRLRRLGASVHLKGESLPDAVRVARALADRLGQTYFEDGGSRWQLDGIASIGRVLAQRKPISVLAPVACGALAGGVALGLRRAGSDAAVIGVQARACSRLAARWHDLPDPPSRPAETIADGLADDRLVEPAFATCRELLRDVLVVDEPDLRAAMRSVHDVTGVVPEAAGAAALAGLHRWPGSVPEGDVAIIVSGANVAPELREAVLREPFEA